MEKGVQRFLEAEETAERLVQTLNELQTEAASYQAATKELDTVRERLLGLIESTGTLVKGSHEVVGVLKEIGGPEILDKLVELERKSSEELDKQSKSLEKLKILIAVTLASSITAIIVSIVAL